MLALLGGAGVGPACGVSAGTGLAATSGAAARTGVAIGSAALGLEPSEGPGPGGERGAAGLDLPAGATARDGGVAAPLAAGAGRGAAVAPAVATVAGARSATRVGTALG